ANKPRTSVAPPIHLFHPVFGHFLDDIKRNDAIPDDTIRLTTEYMKAASAIYANENERRNALTPLLSKILGVDIQTIVNEDKTIPDGMTDLKLGEHFENILIYLTEHKNEIGEGNSASAAQGGLSQGRSWAQPRFKKYRNSTNCPTFVMATAGPWFVILGAVITDGVIVQRLTDYVWVGLDSVMNEPHITRVARILFALKTGLETLRKYYEAVQPSGSASPVDSRYFPSFTEYPGPDNQPVHFKYVGFLEDTPDCTTLHARTDTQPAKDIVVKFVDRYGRGHTACLQTQRIIWLQKFIIADPCMSRTMTRHMDLFLWS
ncbi:hypothetical protein CPB84DRAFT_1947341, partial [Gymnopilus junonius]